MSRITFIATFSLTLSFIVTSHTLFMAASAQSTSTENATSSAATQQSIAILPPGEIDLETLRNNIISTLREPAAALDIKMAQLSPPTNQKISLHLHTFGDFPLLHWRGNSIS